MQSKILLLLLFLLFFTQKSEAQLQFLALKKGIKTMEFTEISYDSSKQTKPKFLSQKTYNELGQLIQYVGGGDTIFYSYQDSLVIMKKVGDPCIKEYIIEKNADTTSIYLRYQAGLSSDCKEAGTTYERLGSSRDSLFLDLKKVMPVQYNAYYLWRMINLPKGEKWEARYFTYPGSMGLQLEAVFVNKKLENGQRVQKKYERSQVPERHLHYRSSLLFDEHDFFLNYYIDESDGFLNRKIENPYIYEFDELGNWTKVFDSKSKKIFGCVIEYW